MADISLLQDYINLILRVTSFLVKSHLARWILSMDKATFSFM
jgi:hypothetical protein